MEFSITYLQKVECFGNNLQKIEFFDDLPSKDRIFDDLPSKRSILSVTNLQKVEFFGNSPSKGRQFFEVPRQLQSPLHHPWSPKKIDWEVRTHLFDCFVRIRSFRKCFRSPFRCRTSAGGRLQWSAKKDRKKGRINVEKLSLSSIL